MSSAERRFSGFFSLLIFLAALHSIIAPTSSGQVANVPDYSKEPFVIERASTIAAFEDDGTYSSVATVRVHVQSQAGVQQFGLLRFSYPSGTSTMDVPYVRVIKSDNRTVDTPAENILDMPADITRQAPLYSDLKERQVAVKGLAIGDTLEYQWRQQVKTPLDPGQFWANFNFFQAGIVLEEDLQIGVPRDRYVKIESPTLQPTIREEGAYRIYTWKTAKLERKPEGNESNPAESEEPARPSVQITTFKTWDAVGQWFRSLASPRAVPTPEIRAKEEELTRGAKTDPEKIQAIYNFVSMRYRYIGISLGIGRYQPHAAADVLTNDYGDCKDKHTLFAALLAAAGMKAYPALISSTTNIDPDIPSPAQFDHVITAVPQGNGYLFLDTTPEVAPFGFLIQSLRDKEALVVPDNGPAALVRTPADPPFKSFFEFRADGALDDTGTFVAKMQLNLRGDLELAYRLVFRQAGQPQWKDVLQGISSNLGFGGTVSDVTASAPEATDVPFHIEYSYERKEYGDWSNKRITPPFPPIFLPAAPPDTEKNPKPIKLGSQSALVYQATMKLPEHSTPTLPLPVDLKEEFAEYHAKYTLTDGVLHAERRLITKAHEISQKEIEAYRKFQKAILDDENTFIPLQGENLASGNSAGTPEAQALYQQGIEAWQQQDMPAALHAFQRAVDKDPKFAPAWIYLGQLHLVLGDADQATEDVKRAMALEPSLVGVYKIFGSSLMGMNHDEKALEIWKDLEKSNPKDADAPQTIATILFRLKRDSEAVPVLESAVDRIPDNAVLFFQLGDAYLHSPDKDKAIVAFQKSADLDSSGFNLSSVAYELTDNNFRLDEALHYAEKAVEEAENATAGITLDNLSLKDLETVPSLGKCWSTLGWVHFRLGHLDQAEAYLRAAWNLGQDAVTADLLGQVYETQGKKSEAATAYSLAIAAGNAPEDTRGRLDALRGGRLRPDERVDAAALAQLRTVKLGKLTTKYATAEFFLLFVRGPKIADLKFISGSEELRTAGKALMTAKFNVSFPDERPVQILRRGVLACDPEASECMFVLNPPDSVNSVN